MFAYSHDILCFSGYLQKNCIKTSDFKNLLLEGADFLVGTQNLPQMIS